MEYARFYPACVVAEPLGISREEFDRIADECTVPGLYHITTQNHDGDRDCIVWCPDPRIALHVVEWFGFRGINTGVQSVDSWINARPGFEDDRVMTVEHILFYKHGSKEVFEHQGDYCDCEHGKTCAQCQFDALHPERRSWSIRRRELDQCLDGNENVDVLLGAYHCTTSAEEDGEHDRLCAEFEKFCESLEKR